MESEGGGEEGFVETGGAVEELKMIVKNEE